MYETDIFTNSDKEDAEFLSDVPLPLLSKLITSQFDEPMDNRKHDYIQSFIDNYRFSIENESDDDQADIEAYYEQFILFMEDVFSKYLDIAFPNIDSMDSNDTLDLLQNTYRFFIKCIKKNFTTLVCNYIEDHRDEFLNTYENKKDVTSISLKDDITDETDIVIISNINQIIRDIQSDVSNNYDVNDFFDACESEDNAEYLFKVKDAYADADIVGNFVPHYIDMIDDSLHSELISKVRKYIFRKYPGRKDKKVNIQTPSEDNTENNTEQVSDNQ